MVVLRGFCASKSARFAHSESKSVKWTVKKYIETAAANDPIRNPNILLRINGVLCVLRAGLMLQGACNINRDRNY
jgi:hypothetical protein